ncbi:MAG: MogA/MoaB family molybdenum cofactor biosynthesis protein [Candidatus Altiarchaeota archaeon]|nr:MogA/MoaB family molybdenum cofactor biosynthesis protein [Candidatus Altiarchaeota archaeon]
MSHKRHKKNAPESVRVAVVTVSDTRTKEDDSSGRIIKETLAENGHRVVEYDVIRDDARMIREKIEHILSSDVDVIITNGGTGVSKRDVTVEALQGLIEKELPGFGELFRYLSYKQIGATAILSRAFAGVSKEKAVICLPGSKNAVTLGMNFIVGELGHLVWEVRK